MTARGVSAKRLATAMGSATSAIATWRAGNNIPRLDTASRLADALDWPRLVDIVREARVGRCVRCGRSFSNEGGTPKRFCSAECREVDATLRERQPVSVLATRVRAEVDRVRGTTAAVSRRELDAALTEYGRSESKRVSRNRTLERRVQTIQEAVDAMCAGCEPSGVCREGDCPLRPVSPFPLALEPGKHADTVEPAKGPHHPDNRPAWLASVRAGNADRWSRPGEREAASAANLARWAAMSPDERAERGRRISVARRRTA